jgi:hypothetical protein
MPGSLRVCSVMPVSITPGATAFTRMPWGASSSAITLVSISTAALEVE